jgi:hypothetical protein
MYNGAADDDYIKGLESLDLGPDRLLPLVNKATAIA